MNSLINTIIQDVFAFFAAVTISYELYANRNKLSFVVNVWKRFSLKMLFEVLGILFLTIVFVSVMWRFSVFRWGWLNIFIGGGGSLYITPISTLTESTLWMVRLLPALFFCIFLITIPFLAHKEEELFRRGYYRWRDIFKQSVWFGLSHMLIGIPIAAAIGLIGVGFFFGYKYRTTIHKVADEELLEFVSSTIKHYEKSGFRGTIKGNFPPTIDEEALMTSTAYHTLYNSVVVSILLLIVSIKIITTI